MEYKWLGACLILSGCAGFGFSLAARYRRKLRGLAQLCRAIDFMTAELKYRLTPLPQLLCLTAGEVKEPLAGIFRCAAGELESRTLPDVKSCFRSALARSRLEPGKLRLLLLELGVTLGKFDLEGQLKGLQYVRNLCAGELEELRLHRRERIRCYQTLSICAGIALVILFL